MKNLGLKGRNEFREFSYGKVSEENALKEITS